MAINIFLLEHFIQREYGTAWNYHDDYQIRFDELRGYFDAYRELDLTCTKPFYMGVSEANDETWRFTLDSLKWSLSAYNVIFASE